MLWSSMHARSCQSFTRSSTNLAHPHRYRQKTSLDRRQPPSRARHPRFTSRSAGRSTFVRSSGRSSRPISETPSVRRRRSPSASAPCACSGTTSRRGSFSASTSPLAIRRYVFDGATDGMEQMRADSPFAHPCACDGSSLPLPNGSTPSFAITTCLRITKTPSFTPRSPGRFLVPRITRLRMSPATQSPPPTHLRVSRRGAREASRADLQAWRPACRGRADEVWRRGDRPSAGRSMTRLAESDARRSVVRDAQVGRQRPCD
jgi:hypothetical protein